MHGEGSRFAINVLADREFEDARFEDPTEWRKLVLDFFTENSLVEVENMASSSLFERGWHLDIRCFSVGIAAPRSIHLLAWIVGRGHCGLVTALELFKSQVIIFLCGLQSYLPMLAFAGTADAASHQW